MGCILAGRTASVADCKKQCDAAAGLCEYNVVSPAGPFHAPGETTQNQTLEQCSDCTYLSNGTMCNSCGHGNECEAGCEFGAPASSSGGVWKALLRPTVTAGGSYTVTVSSSDVPASETLELERVTFGDVFYCSGQSNMALSLRNTFSKPQLDEDVKSGACLCACVPVCALVCTGVRVCASLLVCKWVCQGGIARFASKERHSISIGTTPSVRCPR